MPVRVKLGRDGARFPTLRCHDSSGAASKNHALLLAANGVMSAEIAGGRPARVISANKTIAMAEIEDNVDRELFRNIEKLRQLRIEHRDLDDVIERLTMDIHTNELQLKRLKKRKLMLKDQITRMESQLIPDLNA